MSVAVTMDQETLPQPRSEGITVRELFQEIRASRALLVAFVIVCACAGVVVGSIKAPAYEATTVLLPVSSDDDTGRGSSGLSAMISQYSDVASMVGFGHLGDSSSAKDEAIATLTSELLTERYIRDNNLLPTLYSKLWDPERRAWRVTDPKKMPTLWKANNYFKRIRGVVDDKKTNTIDLTITWKDPKVAAKWANDLVQLTNSYLRDRAIRESQRNIDYLNEEVAKTNVVEAQRAIYSLLEGEIQRQMLARGRDEYSLKVIDPAFAPERPSSLGPLVLAILGAGVGIMLSLLWVLVKKIVQAM
jgi:uncharacterized protein involved in exopolysaccharide biosynthesis